MNNKGQSLVTFVLILPILVLMLAFVIDSSICIMEKSKIDGAITSNMEEALKNDIRDEDRIGNAIKKNEDIDVLVSIVENDLKVIAKSNKKSVFGKLLKFEYYQLNYDYCANYIDKKINKKCG
jgi:hypothetical protein